jgi:hypothetical protein
VEQKNQRLLVGFVEDSPLDLAQGEWKEEKLWISNQGGKEVEELWLVCDPEDEIWISSNDKAESREYGSPSLPNRTHSQLVEAKEGSFEFQETFISDNSLHSLRPYAIPLQSPSGADSLLPAEITHMTITFHAGRMGEHDLRLLFVYRTVRASSTTRAERVLSFRSGTSMRSDRSESPEWLTLDLR